jgi:hypothetical protein
MQKLFVIPQNRSPVQVYSVEDVNRLLATTGFSIPIGLVGDGVTDDSEAIQDALDLGGCIYLPKPTVAYRINAGLIMSNQATRLIGASMISTIILNYSTEATIKVTAQYCVVEHLALFGSVQASYGVGATTPYGVEFVAADYSVLNRVAILYHQYGIYNHGGGSSIEIYSPNIRHCTYDGLNSVTITGDEQNGNALMIYGGGFNLCGGAGIRWSAASLGLYGVRCEANIGPGLSIDSSASSITSKGVGVYGGYYEQNRGGQIEIHAGAGFYGGVISGVYLRWGLGGGASSRDSLIVGRGVGLIQLLEIQHNTYSLFPVDPTVTYWVNLGNRSTDSCTINTMQQPSLFTQYNTAKIVSFFTSADIDSSTKLRSIVGDETGTGLLVFSNNPQFNGLVSIGSVTSPGAATPLRTISDTNAAGGPEFFNQNAGTSVAGVVKAGLSSTNFLQLGACINGFAVASLSNRGFFQPTAALAGVTGYLATGQDFNVVINNVEQFRVGATTVAGETGLVIYDVNSGAMQRVKVGAAGTGPGGVGRALYLV